MCRRASEFVMPFHNFSAGRGPWFVCLAASLLALGLAGCGRRGPLEAPPEAAAPAPRAAPASTRAASRTVATQPASASIATQPQSVTLDTPEDETDEEDVTQGVVPTPNPTPGSRKRGRGYTIPKDPFILDPLL
jgi:predicted small lipoprotein YifL